MDDRFFTNTNLISAQLGETPPPYYLNQYDCKMKQGVRFLDDCQTPDI